MTIRLLLIDGDAVFRDHVGVQLTRAGDFTVTALADGRTAAAAGHDAAVLDAGLAAPSAPSLCANWRAAGETFPVIVLTPPDNPAMAASALDAGADGWLAKPLRLADLLARVRAAVRGGDGPGVAFGPYQFRAGAKELIAGDRPIRLTEKETQILQFLLAAAGQTVSRETLLGEVWGYAAAVTTHTLETHIYRLRQKIEADPAEARLLATEPGGYRLNI